MLDTGNIRKTSVIIFQCRTDCKNAHDPNWDEKKKKLKGSCKKKF